MFSNALRKSKAIGIDFLNIKVLGKLPTFYYNKVNNVGDILNAFLLQQVCGKDTYIVRTRVFRHVLPIGSILHFSSPTSYVWGSGLISPGNPENVQFASILAVRGHLTQAEISKQSGVNLKVPLGDPALLMPRYYTPASSRKTHRIGLIPHYVDQDSEIIRAARDLPGLKIISVQQSHDSFINEIASCEAVFSSSLHGLILSDAYGVPNKWISFSDKIIGGSFKFRDYYSTTAMPDEACAHVENASELTDLLTKAKTLATVKPYHGDLNQLEQVLRNRF
ncbi:polysaccharide pyruvyl transferase family protein [Hydrocarboniclastica marina]|nr:polysaccharide pyruvyl transferase family protein [Hydrocarboniclastica marina]